MSSNVALGNGSNTTNTATKKEEFLSLYPKTRNISKTAEAIKINPRTVYNWKESDPQFAKALLQAEQVVGDYYVGKVDDRIEKERSDILLMFMTKRYKPEFRDNPQVVPQLQDNRQINIILHGGKDAKEKLQRLLSGKVPPLAIDEEEG